MAKKVVKKRVQVARHVPDDFLVFLAVGVIILGGGMWLLGMIR